MLISLKKDITKESIHMMKIIHKYILKEISYPFLMILFVLTFVLLMGRILQLMDLMINKGVGVDDIGRLIFYLIPSFLIFTIPISLLISILIGLGRLSGDNEITVFKASGISVYTIIRPVLLASFLAFLVTAVTSLFGVPQANQARKYLLFNIAQKQASIGIKERVFNDDFNGILLYADKIPADGSSMEGVFVSDNRLGSEPSTIIAERAYLISDDKTMTMTLRLQNGSTHVVSTDLKNYRKLDFHFYDISLNIASSLAETRKEFIKKPADMTYVELLKTIKTADIDPLHKRQIAIEMHKKLTIPISCLVFGMIGIPLGIRPTRSVKSKGFVVGIFIVLAYYLLQISGDALAETGRLSPVIATWTPNVLFGLSGIYLLIFAAREKPISISIPDWLTKLLAKKR